MCKTGQMKIYILRELRSFTECSKLLGMVYKPIEAKVTDQAVVCWGNIATDRGMHGEETNLLRS